MARERFGPYLLLKKLSEDPLGEVFRAGRVQDTGLDQVVLLRTFNGSAIEVPNLGDRLEAARPLQGLLRSPNLAQGVDLGTQDGIPFVAYDYISGRDLSSLREQAARRSHPVPAEHALLIAERLALGLSVAHGTRFQNHPIVHGFLVPQFIMLSNEGENRLLGFEVSSALRSTPPDAALWQHFGRYLAPEARSGGPPSPTDDVYSLGILLLELLTGRAAADSTSEETRAAIHQTAARGLPNVGALIERSLAPAAERIPNVSAWHQKLSELVLSRQVSSTPFHLAFYMHNLFRDEIERESQEIERERTVDMSRGDLAAAPPAERSTSQPLASSPSLRATAAAGGASAPATEPARKPPAKAPTAARPGGASAPWRWILLAAALLLLGAAGWYAWQMYGPTAEATVAETATTDLVEAPSPAPLLPQDGVGLEDGAPPPAEGAPLFETVAVDGLEEGFVEPEPEAEAEPEAIDPQALLQRIDQLVAERTQSMERNLRGQYDQELEALREQLAAAEAAREEERLRAEQLAEQQKQAAQAAEQAKTAAKTPEQPAGQTRTAAASGAATDARSPGTAGVAAASSDGGAAPTSTAPTRSAGTEPATRRAPARPPEPERVTLGELVRPGPGVAPPRLQSTLDPVYPLAARRLRKEATVELEVLVDENGQVIDMRQSRKAGYGFDESARAAARRATYAPATKNGVRVKMWTALKVQFRQN